MHVKENFVVSASFTATQSSVYSLLYNVRVNGAKSGSFERAISSFKLDSLTAPGVVTVSPKFMYGLGLTYDTAQSVDVQAGAVVTLSGAAADMNIKEQTATNARNWQSSAQVTYPKLTQPGRVVLSPYIKTDFQLSLTIFGQYVENAAVLTTQINMGFDAEVLTTSQVVTRRSTIGQAQLEGTSDLAKRQFFGEGLMAKIRAAQAAIAAAQAAQAAKNTCNAGSMKLNAIMNTKNQAVVGGKPTVLFNQPLKFGSQW